MFLDQTILLLIPVMILAFYAQYLVKHNYKKYDKFPNNLQLSGAEAARKFLDRSGLYNVEVKETSGELSDHYDPRDNTVYLSSKVYHNKSLSSVSISSHEVGHAIQHAKNYMPLNLRSMIFPIANIGSKGAFPLFIIGLFINQGFLMDLGIFLFVGALFFHIVTLPVEFNASKRALAFISDNIASNNNENKACRKVLNAAALTYVASTLMALVQLIRLLVLRDSRR